MVLPNMQQTLKQLKDPVKATSCCCFLITISSLHLNELNPCEIQKILVEHIVRNEDEATHVHSSLRLRAVSGKISRHESDYDTLNSHVELLNE